MATHGLLWMDARSEMRDNALFHLKKLWGFLDMPDGPVIGEMFWDNMTNLDSGGVLLVRGTMVVWPGVEVVAGGGAAEEMQEETSNVADGKLALELWCASCIISIDLCQI